jgi:hypothetical protein
MRRENVMIPEKACPGLDPGWEPVFAKDHAPRKCHDPRKVGTGFRKGSCAAKMSGGALI